MYKEDEDWSYMGINMPPGWCIELLKGEYKGVRVIFSDVQLQKEDGTVITGDEGEDDDIRLSFGYEALEPHKELNHNDKFEAYISDIMYWMIEEGLNDDKGTIQFYDTESEQGDTTITIKQ